MEPRPFTCTRCDRRPQNLFNVSRARARQGAIARKKHSLNEHSERDFNAAWPTRRLRIGPPGRLTQAINAWVMNAGVIRPSPCRGETAGDRYLQVSKVMHVTPVGIGDFAQDLESVAIPSGGELDGWGVTQQLNPLSRQD